MVTQVLSVMGSPPLYLISKYDMLMTCCHVMLFLVTCDALSTVVAEVGHGRVKIWSHAVLFWLPASHRPHHVFLVTCIVHSGG